MRNAFIFGPDAPATTELRELLDAEGLGSEVVDPASGLERLEAEAAELVFVEASLLVESMSLLETLRQGFPPTPVVVLGDESTAATTALALRAGATDALTRPFDVEAVRLLLEKLLALAERRASVEPSRLDAPGALLGDAPAMREACAVLDRAARGNATVLVRGESGTGKELVARAVHERSARSAGPFVKIDCAALPDTLLESELFGYEKGAFTGATARKPGRVEVANGGTLFLDEIGELTPALQAKLLRLLQDRQFERLGGVTTVDVDVRIVAATHRDLENMIQKNLFRSDLFYRLNVVPIWLPPLRARRGDIPTLARHFCKATRADYDRPTLEIEPAAIDELRKQRWPGNVRQLQNFVERLVVMAEGATITVEDVRREAERQVRFVTEPAATAEASRPVEGSRRSVERLSAELRAAEKRALLNALAKAGGNRSLAARLLGVSRSYLYRKLGDYQLG